LIVEIRHSGEVAIVTMVERFDAYSAKDVQTALEKVIDDGSVKLVCDFSQTDYISSAGLRVLLATAKRLKREGGAIALCCMKPYVREVFETAGFTQLFQIFNSEEEAADSL